MKTRKAGSKDDIFFGGMIGERDEYMGKGFYFNCD